MAEIIFKNGKFSIDKPLYQWDKNITLRIKGLSLPSTPEIHFSNSTMGGAIVKTATVEDGVVVVTIPNGLLQVINNLKVYVCFYQGEEFTTNYKFILEITPREKPGDYSLQDDEDVYSFNELRALVESYKDQVDGKIQGAKTQIDTDFTVRLNTQRSEIDSEIHRVEAQANANYKTVNERVNNLVATDPGSTGDNAELLDIRVGSDGKTYPTAGDAVRGQVGDLKGDLVDVEVLRAVNFLTSNSGFISAGGNYNSSSNFKITEPFEVKKGEIIKLTASGYNTSVSMITQWINDDYHPLVVCRSSNEEEYEYVAESDMEIILSYNSLLEYSSVIVRPIVSYVDSECKKLDDKIEAEKNKIIDVDFTGDEFGYYNPWGTFYDAPNFKHTKPFILYEGETVTLVASEYNDSISAIARYNGGVVTSLVRSTQTEETTYSYTAEEDMYIILCYNVFMNHYAKIKMTAKSQLKRSGVDFDELPNYSMMFETMCGIGDSLMSGALSYRDDQGELKGKDVYGNSWLSTIARENGATRKHLSSGGKTTKAWLTSYADELISDPVYSAYFIGLGTNDAYFKEYELGTINDAKGTNTFVGYYKDVIERVRAKAPNSAIFCLSLYSNATGYDAYSNMIEEITKLYSGVFFVDFINKSDVIIETDGYSSAGHFTTLGYVRVAKNIKNIVNDVIKNNMSYFNMYAWDNTSSNR